MECSLLHDVSQQLDESQYMLRMADAKINNLQISIDYLTMQLARYGCPCGEGTCCHDPFQRQNLWRIRAENEADMLVHGDH